MSISISIPRRVRSRFVVLTAIVALASVAIGLGLGTADAAGTTHKLSTNPVNSGGSYEGSAKMTFTCNDSTGAWKLGFTNVQVIRPDRVSVWAPNAGSPYVFSATAQLTNPAHTSSTDAQVELKQTKSGLYNGTLKGHFSASGVANWCVKNATVAGADGNSGGTYLHFAPVALT